MRSKFIFLVALGMGLALGQGFSQSDTIYESFNGICTQTITPYKNYIIDFESETGVKWNIKTYYVPEAGGIDDEGNKVDDGSPCGSLFWTYGKSGYARATIQGGITMLTFQVASGWFQKNGFVRVLVDGIEIGQTNPINDYEVHSFAFAINTPGPLDLELVHGIDGTSGGGILVDNLKITPKEGERPFISVEDLEEYDPGMDTLKAVTDTMLIDYYAEGCLKINGKFIDYFDRSDNVSITVGSVIDLNPGDSCNIYYWGSALPGSDSPGDELPVSFYLPVNTSSDTINFTSTPGGDEQEGMLSFINGNVDYDLVVFKLTGLDHEYRIRYAFDYYTVSTNGTGDDVYRPSIEFYPNPVQNHAYFRTGKELILFEVMDLNGRIILTETHPEQTAAGNYRLNLENLSKGIWIVRFRYADESMDAVKIIVN